MAINFISRLLHQAVSLFTSDQRPKNAASGVSTDAFALTRPIGIKDRPAILLIEEQVSSFSQKSVEASLQSYNGQSAILMDLSGLRMESVTKIRENVVAGLRSGGASVVVFSAKGRTHREIFSDLADCLKTLFEEKGVSADLHAERNPGQTLRFGLLGQNNLSPSSPLIIYIKDFVPDLQKDDFVLWVRGICNDLIKNNGKIRFVIEDKVSGDWVVMDHFVTPFNIGVELSPTSY